MKRTIGWGLLVLLLGGLAAFIYYRMSPPAEPPAPVAQPLPAAPPGAQEAPEIQYPIEAVEAVPATEAPAPLPAEAVPAPEAAPAPPTLDQSDELALRALAALITDPELLQLVVPSRLIRHIVVTIDNLPREKVAVRLWPLRPVGGPFLVDSSTGAPVIAAQNAARYAPYVRLARTTDAVRLVAAYVRLYPYFQQAYRELGYPGAYFNDRLVEVLDHLLAAPVPAPPIALAQPHVLYTYADPELEARSAGQKILMRMGAENATAIKDKLRAIRALVARGQAGR
jgi:hypothetical protein